MTVPMVTFGGKRRVASFRVAGAGVAFCDIPTCLFMTCRKPFCVAGAILLQGYQKMACIFPGQRSTLNVSIFILRGRRSTSDVSCRVFLRTALSGLRQVVTTCKLHGRRIRHRENVILRGIGNVWCISRRIVSDSLHFTIYTPFSTLYTLHSTFYTPHSTLYTPHFTL